MYIIEQLKQSIQILQNLFNEKKKNLIYTSAVIY